MKKDCTWQNLSLKPRRAFCCWTRCSRTEKEQCCLTLLPKLKRGLITTHQQCTQKTVRAACKGHPQHYGFHMPCHVSCPGLENICLSATGGEICCSKKGEVCNAANKPRKSPHFKVGISSFSYRLMKCKSNCSIA